MPSINNLSPLTETDALNIMLSQIGEAPVADIDTATAADAVMAKDILREIAREILEEGWRFNMEFGYQLAPTTTQAWTGADGSSATLNVFEVPANLARFEVSACPEQTGFRAIDIVARQGRTYDPTKIIFYDRAKNRDGLDASLHPVLYIDPVWYFDFEMCPASIRRLITVVSARKLAENATNSETLSAFSQDDEARAYRLARKDQGEKDDLNMLDESSLIYTRGINRSWGPVGRVDYRRSPRQV
jgi:hypothetical protein